MLNLKACRHLLPLRSEIVFGFKILQVSVSHEDVS